MRLGDLDALKEQINATDFDFGDYYDNTDEIRKRVCEVIDNAQPISPYKALHDELHKGEEE